jgi:hypothetical protein
VQQTFASRLEYGNARTLRSREHTTQTRRSLDDREVPVHIDLPAARSVATNPTQAQLREWVVELMPPDRVTETEFGNLNYRARILARLTPSTFFVSDEPTGKPTMSRAEAAAWADKQDAYIAERDMVLIEGYIGPDPEFRTGARLFIEKANANVPGMQEQLFFARDADWVPQFTVIYKSLSRGEVTVGDHGVVAVARSTLGTAARRLHPTAVPRPALSGRRGERLMKKTAAARSSGRKSSAAALVTDQRAGLRMNRPQQTGKSAGLGQENALSSVVALKLLSRRKCCAAARQLQVPNFSLASRYLKGTGCPLSILKDHRDLPALSSVTSMVLDVNYQLGVSF